MGSNFGDIGTVPAGLTNVTAIAAGSGVTVALKSDGTIVAWGYNGDVQTNIPPGLSNVTAIAAGLHTTLALKTDGTVVAWGWWGFDGLSNVTAIASSSGHTLALKRDGTVVAWGLNNYGQTTVPVAAQNRVTAIAAGGWHTVAIVIPIAPAITTQPVSQAVNAGQSASFTVVATGAASFNYQWRKDGNNLSGAVGATYRLNNAWLSDAGSYTVVVSNSAGSVTSAPPAVLTVNGGASRLGGGVGQRRNDRTRRGAERSDGHCGGRSSHRGSEE